MSFCVQVKNELIAIRPSSCCKPALVYGFMLFGRSFSLKSISLQTTNGSVANAYCDLVYSLYKIKPDIRVGGKKIPTYKANITSETDRLKVLATVDFGINECIIDKTFFKKDCCIHSFVRGAFLACGNINNPEKEYRAEFNVKNEKLALELKQLLLKYGINMKISKRANGLQLYVKDSESVEDLLTLIGAGKKTLSIIDTKMLKEVKNKINRAGNCDSGNISKTVEASIKQRRAIEFLENTDRLERLPQELLDAALLRKNNPNATLKELCRLSNTSITVSGLNHRLNKIISIYEEIKE